MVRNALSRLQELLNKLSSLAEMMERPNSRLLRELEGLKKKRLFVKVSYKEEEIKMCMEIKGGGDREMKTAYSGKYPSPT
jgi:hypothetical protein